MRPEGARSYLLAAPEQTSAGKRPLVIVLHGAGANAAQVLGLAFPPSPLSVWLDIGAREQLVIVAPNGRKKSWDDSFAHSFINPDVDDTGFISAIIDQSIADNDVDPARVYVIGASKGGVMAYRLASDIAPKLAAFCAVLAAMPVKSKCAAPTLALSTLIIAGTADPLVPYFGGRGFYYPLLGKWTSVDQSVAVWRTLARIFDAPAVSDIAPRNASDPTRATRFVWGADPCKLQVAHVRIDKGGHAEPSAVKRYPRLLSRLVGAQNADFEVAEEAWAFFKDKRRGLLP